MSRLSITLTVFFSVFVDVVGSFDENTRFSWSRCVGFFRIPRKLSCPWYRCQCFWNDTEKISMSLRSVDAHQSRSVVQFYVAQSHRCCVSLSFVSSQGRVFCILVASYGHVSLIVGQLDWQRCRSPFVESLVSRCET